MSQSADLLPSYENKDGSMGSVLCCVKIPSGTREGDEFKVVLPEGSITVSIACPRFKVDLKGGQWVRVIQPLGVRRVQGKVSTVGPKPEAKARVRKTNKNQSVDGPTASATGPSPGKRRGSKKRKHNEVSGGKGIFTEKAKRLNSSSPGTSPSMQSGSAKRKKDEVANKHSNTGKNVGPSPDKVGERTEATRRKNNQAPDLYKLHNVDVSNAVHKIRRVLRPPFNKSNVVAKFIGYFYLFCHERQLVWRRRNRDEVPLTVDPIIANTFFCNVFRESDRGTAYFRSQMMDKLRGMTGGRRRLKETLWSSIVYRLLNRIQTFQRFGGIPSTDQLDSFLELLRGMKGKNEVIATGAHIVLTLERYTETTTFLSRNGGAELEALASSVDRNALAGGSEGVKGVFDAIKRLKNIGNFFAWQVTCDLFESRVLYACSENDWVQLGPGAKAGADICFSKVKHKKSYLELAQVLVSKQNDFFDALGVKFFKFRELNMSLKNIEHALCEFQKYMALRQQLEQGRKLKGQRRFGMSKEMGSRSYMDAEKVCIRCNRDEDTIVFCDMCLEAYCPSCKDGGIEESADVWICAPCNELENA